MFNLFRKKTAPPAPDLPQAFGYKCAWLAIRSASVLEVTGALRLSHTEAANWATGLEQAYAGQMFVSPAVGKWVLAISTRLLTKLSQRFGEAQYFGTHGVVEYQAWAKARQGQIVRAYAWLGESGATLWNIGSKTREELELGLTFLDEAAPEAASASDGPQTGAAYPNEESVLGMARKWSIDPAFPAGLYAPGVGVSGIFTS